MNPVHSLYYFDFLRTVSAQLKASLDATKQTSLSVIALAELSSFQKENKSRQGVYVVHYEGQPVYVGKANDVSDRLSEHYQKLTGRKGILIEEVSYKAVLLDKSMSTAANEDILIGMFREDNEKLWNGTGFGPRDPGKERDTTKPGKFDTQFPIKDQLLVDLGVAPGEEITLRSLCKMAKEQLPYIFRYNIPAKKLDQKLILPDICFSARNLLQVVVNELGPGWKGAVISYGMVLYKTTKEYPHGDEILPVTFT